MKICMIGVGYVGLVTGAGFADVGNSVICVDIDAQKIDKLKKGLIPIFEPGLEELVKHNEEKGRLHFTTDLSDAISQSDICFIAVGTPPAADGSPDLRAVMSVARDIGKAMEAAGAPHKMIGIKSTVPVGTGDHVRQVIGQQTRLPFYVFSNPEFLKEGDAINDFMSPDRIIVGSEDESVRESLRELYQPFNRKENRLLFMSSKSAELTKYAANAMLATRISFMNELANLAEKVGANIEDIRVGIGSDSRIGDSFLFPGIGYGGSCLPKDIQALLQTARATDIPLRVVEAVESANAAQKQSIFRKVSEYFHDRGGVANRHIAIWGLAFKPNTDDIRDAPALALIEALLVEQVNVSVYDPAAMHNVAAVFGDRIQYAPDPYAALKDADALVIATEWHDFRSPDVEAMRCLMKQMVVFDGRNVYAKSRSFRKACAFYTGIGLSAA